MSERSRVTVICGHYGCGKTNLALNLALEAAAKGEKVTVADLDIVNLYFRSSEYGGLLEEHGVVAFAKNVIEAEYIAELIEENARVYWNMKLMERGGTN